MRELPIHFFSFVFLVESFTVKFMLRSNFKSIHIEGGEGIDIVGDNTDEVTVQVMTAAGGKPVVYIHVNGATIFRLGNAKSIKVEDERISRG